MKDLASGVGLLNFFDYSISMTRFDELFYMDIHPGLGFGDGEFGFNVYYGINAALLSSVSSSNVRTNFGLAYLKNPWCSI